MNIYLAGTESSQENGCLVSEAKTPYVLASYFHAAYGRGPRFIRSGLIAVLTNAKERLIDSGAFTLRTAVGTVFGSGHTNAVGKQVDYDSYTDAYIEWLKHKKHLGLIDWWVEMDIGAVVGQGWVHKARDKFVRAGLGAGLINVWHSEQDWDYWLHLLREARRPGRSRYVAIEGHQPTRRPLDYNRFLREAYNQGVKVHGFKMTVAEDLRRWPFYSVDSTTWNVAVHAGVSPSTVRQGGMIQCRPNKRGHADKGIRLHWRGPIPRRQTRGWRRQILLLSLRKWIDASRIMTNYWLSRGIDWDKAIADAMQKELASVPETVAP